MSDNFWAMGDTGPCGRCSEIYYDRGDAVPGTGDFVTDTASGSERFVEIWNNVFMEFERQADGTLRDLPARSIDTGMGLERISAVHARRTLSNYDTELFQPILRALSAMARATVPGWNGRQRRLDAGGRRPHSRNYVPHRRWCRALERMARLRSSQDHAARDAAWAEAGVEGPVLVQAGGRRHRRNGRRLSRVEVRAAPQSSRSFEARRSGLASCSPRGCQGSKRCSSRRPAATRWCRGDQAFKLYDTYGLPRDFIEDLTSAQDLRFDTEGFEQAMQRQREMARGKSAFSGAQKVAWNTRPEASEDLQTARRFPRL